MRKYVAFLLCFLLAVPFTAAPRKKVAVVLGGGGAKGVAHIGILKTIEKAGIPIDIVAGTSMGAIVGGLYAIGYTPEEIETMVREQDWEMLLSDRIERNSLFFPEKENAERYVLSLPFGKEKKDRIIDGVIKGQNLQNLFANLTIGYHDSVDFRSFRIPFACVAVDLVSGQDYVFRRGSLPLAMRASMAIPAVFTPVRLDSMVLVDGGLNNNYPVDVAKEMGADIIIGVDLGTSDLRAYERLYSPGDIVTQIVALHGYEAYVRNKEQTDLLFRPDMEPYRSASFYRSAIDTMIKRGEQEAERHWDEIIALKKKIGITGNGQALRNEQGPATPLRATDRFYIRHISYEGADPRDEKWLKRIGGLHENSYITQHELQRCMDILIGTDAYAYVTYKLTGEKQSDLVFTLQPKSLSSVHLGIRFDTEEIIGVLANVRFNYRKHFRSRVALTGRAGDKTSYVRLDYSIERSALRNFNIAYQCLYQDLDIYRKGKKMFNTAYFRYLAEFAYSDMNWLNFKVKMGIRYEYFDYNAFLYAGEEGDYQVNTEGFIGYFASAQLETLDRRYFPTRGISLEADYTLYTDDFVKFRKKSPFSALKVNMTTVVPLTSRLSFLPAAYGRFLIGKNLAYPFLNAMGGTVFGRYYPQQLPFAGINHLELFNQALAVGRLQLRYRIAGRHYVTLTGNYAVHHDDFFHLFDGQHLWGGSIGYAYNSMMGPLSLSISTSNHSKRMQGFLNLGFFF